MDIASLLSPCPDPSPSSQRQKLGSESADEVDDSSQLASLTTSGARRTPPTTSNSMTALPPVKRKRKRQLSAQQKQVMHENRRGESQLYNLTLDVNELKQQVRNYMVHKSIHATRTLVSRQNFEVSVLRTTWRLFELFRTGYRDWETHEAAFLGATIDPNIAISSELRGVDLFFDQWRRYKNLLQVRFVSISSANILISDPESCVVECKGEFEGRLTLAAIETLFPHILQDVELLGKVINSRLVCPTRSLIYFDASGRIVRYDAHADMFAGLSRILSSNPMDVITLMSGARISSEDSIIPDAANDDKAQLVEHTEADESGLAPASPNDSDSVASSGSPSSSSSCSSRSSVE